MVSLSSRNVMGRSEGKLLFKRKSKDRFSVSYRKGALAGFRVIVDKQTGVNYLFACEGNAGGLTVLVDKDGKPIITKEESKT